MRAMQGMRVRRATACCSPCSSCSPLTTNSSAAILLLTSMVNRSPTPMARRARQVVDEFTSAGGAINGRQSTGEGHREPRARSADGIRRARVPRSPGGRQMARPHRPAFPRRLAHARSPQPRLLSSDRSGTLLCGSRDDVDPRENQRADADGPSRNRGRGRSIACGPIRPPGLSRAVVWQSNRLAPGSRVGSAGPTSQLEPAEPARLLAGRRQQGRVGAEPASMDAQAGTGVPPDWRRTIRGGGRSKAVPLDHVQPTGNRHQLGQQPGGFPPADSVVLVLVPDRGRAGPHTRVLRRRARVHPGARPSHRALSVLLPLAEHAPDG